MPRYGTRSFTQYGSWLATMAASLVASRGYAAGITPGDVVIYRVGDGTNPLVSTGTAVFLDEYSATGVLVQSIPMPTQTSGNNAPLISGGTASSEGELGLSADGRFLLVPGYAAALGGSTTLSSSSSTSINRTAGLVSTTTGAVDTSNTFQDWSTANNPRSIASPDGVNLYLSGGAGGVRYASANGTKAQTSTQLSTTVTNTRQLNIFNGQLYVTSSSGSAVRLGAVGSGLPTTSGQTITNIPGFETSTGSPYGFFFASENSIDDTVYVADDGTNTGIQKFNLVSGSWVAEGNVSAAAGVRGLTGVQAGLGGTVTLYATTGSSTATASGTLWSLTDSGGYQASISSDPLTTLASAPSGESFRGVVFVPEPTSFALIGVGMACLLRRRRRTDR